MNIAVKTHPGDPMLIGRFMLTALLAIAIYTMWITTGHACSGIGGTIETLTATQFGDVVVPLGTLGIMIIGISAMLGRISWATALTVVIGIAVVAAAYQIASDAGAPTC